MENIIIGHRHCEEERRGNLECEFLEHGLPRFARNDIWVEAMIDQIKLHSSLRVYSKVNLKT